MGLLGSKLKGLPGAPIPPVSVLMPKGETWGAEDEQEPGAVGQGKTVEEWPSGYGEG